MGRSTVFLKVLRVLALVVALAIVGLGVWSKVIIHDVEVRGIAVLETTQLQSLLLYQDWRDYFIVVLNGGVRLWISIAAAFFASLASILLVSAILFDRMHMSAKLLVPIEALSMCSLAVAFGTSLSFALSVDPFGQSRLDSSDSSGLKIFAMLVPLSKGYVAAVGTGWFLVLVACIVATVDACDRARVKESCSFEPTASALGMGHGYAAIVPQMARSRVPTMYDPRRPHQVEPKLAPKEDDEEKSFAKEGGLMARADSALSEERKESIEVENEITGPLNLEMPQRVLQIRPSRPWSEMPVSKKKDGVVHAM